MSYDLAHCCECGAHLAGDHRPGCSIGARVLAFQRDEVEPCTSRCSSLHALDCPNYSGPLSRTGSLESAPHWSDTTGQTL